MTNRWSGFLGAMLPVVLIASSIVLSQWPDSASSGVAGDRPALSQNYPNPFNPSTTIQYDLREAGMVSLRLFNILGVEIATLVNGRQEAGSHAVRLNAGAGTPGFTAGVYFYRLETGSVVSTRKMVLLD